MGSSGLIQSATHTYYSQGSEIITEDGVGRLYELQVAEVCSKREFSGHDRIIACIYS